MQHFRILACVLLLLTCLQSFSQKNKNTAKIKFGDVKPEDFAPTVYSVDSNASAVVLADIGESKFKGGNNSNLLLEYNHIKRIRLLNKNSFDEATIQILLWLDGQDEERLENIEAATYNIENGKVVTTKLDKGSIFKDKYDKNRTVRKFTFPNIKEGSIIEYRYTTSSPFFFNLQPWEFQAAMPRLWSEYTVTIPQDIYDFVVMQHGYLPYTIDTAIASKETYSLLDPGGINAAQVFTIPSATVTAHWAMENVPPVKPENYITTMDNYTSRVEFQLRRAKYSETHIVDHMGTWNNFVDRLMKREDFGVPLTDNNGWLGDELKRVTAGASGDLAKAHKWYEYVRDNFTCNSAHGKYMTKTLKKTMQDKNGDVGDLNLLLIAGLKKLGLDASPAVLSTRDNGVASEIYPLVSQYNYVIANVKIDDVNYTLDATDKAAGFGVLDDELYNGGARLIDVRPLIIPLQADSIKDSKVTTVFITNDENGKGMMASFSSKLGLHEGMSFRRRMKKQSNDDYFKAVKKNIPFETTLSETEIDSLNIPDEPVTVKYSFTFNPNDEDILYVTPLLGEAYKENPFKAAERLYPVEMPYCSDETYIFNMEIPKGYKVDELPKSARIKLNETDGMFEYIIAQGGGRVQLRCRISLKKANFTPDDYQTLRQFFGAVVSKQAEQIVLKKI